jgi:hypothetical protein
MRPRPKKPGETVAEYNAFIANLPKRGGQPGTGPKPKPMPMPPSGGGRGRGGATPPPGMMYGPNDALMPIPKKGGSATGGGRPVMRAKGGMVKGKKK